MRVHRSPVFAALVLWSAFVPSRTWGQAAGAAGSQTLVGTVVQIDIASRTLHIKTDQNQQIRAIVRPEATIRRTQPDETDLKKAVSIGLSEIAVGDRVAARGTLDGTDVQATSILSMAKSDLAAKRTAEESDWNKRGISGVVTGVSGGVVTARVQDRSGTHPVTISLDKSGNVRRYAPNSIRFVDAVPSTIDAIRVGDQIRARGEKGQDGLSIVAIEIVAGAFRSIAGLVQAVTPASSELRIRDLDSKLVITVKIDPASKLQRASAQVAQQVAARLRRGTAAPNAGSAEATPQQLLDASPSITLADLHTGDAVVISSTAGEAADRITAVSLMAGVEPILTKPGTQEMSIGSWNLSVGTAIE